MNYINPKELKENPNNPRTITDKKFNQLVKSIKDFPQMLELRPIVVTDDMTVLGGNMRLKACIEAGLEKVPYIKAESLTEEQQKEFIIKDNVGYGEWDWDVLQQEWNIDLLEDWGMEVIKHDWSELEYIEDEQSLPEETRDNKLVIIICEACMPDKDQIQDDINNFLSENYSGCEIK